MLKKLRKSAFFSSFILPMDPDPDSESTDSLNPDPIRIHTPGNNSSIGMQLRLWCLPDVSIDALRSTGIRTVWLQTLVHIKRLQLLHEELPQPGIEETMAERIVSQYIWLLDSAEYTLL
jgi:hypothetical protein